MVRAFSARIPHDHLMFKSSIKRSKVYSNFMRLREFLKRMKIRPIHLIIPSVLALGATLFEGISVGLLIPTVKGIIERDFDFVRHLPVLGNGLDAFPHMLTRGNSAVFMFLVGFIFVSALAKNVLQYLSYLSVAFQVRRFTHDLRKLVYERYLSFGKLFFDCNNEGYLHQVLVGYTQQIAQQVLVLNTALYQFFTLFAYFFIMFNVSWELTIFITVIFPISHFSFKRLIRKIRRTSESYAESYSQLGKKISNALTCIPLVKAYTNEEKEKQWFAQTNDLVQKLEFSVDKKWLLLTPLHEIIMLFVFLALVGTMTFLLIGRGSGDIAGFTVFLVALKKSMYAFGFFSQAQASLASVRGPILEVMDVLNDRGKYFIPDGKRNFKGLSEVIEFKDLNFSYPRGVQALKGVTFLIEKRKMTAIVGSSGSGKTTLINLIMRFYDCPPGTLKMDGVDIKDFSLASLRRKMALVSQDPLLVNAPLRFNLTYGLNGKVVSDLELVEAVKRAKLYDFIMELPERFETEIGDRGVKLAGGEKQRVAIARAILKNPEILLLDEATSSLDSQTERLIQEALNELVRDKTTVVVAHRLSTIKHADKIIVMENGRLVEQGALGELLSRKSRFYEYWEAQKFY